MIKNKKSWFLPYILALFMLAGILTGCGIDAVVSSGITDTQTTQAGQESTATQELSIEKDGTYTTAEEVALYLHTYGKLPSNYITKKAAQKLGWDSRKGNLEEVAPGKSIGGSHYGNYEKALPEQEGRTYYECDLNYEGGYRGADRLIYSSDGLIYHTADHYKTFTQLY